MRKILFALIMILTGCKCLSQIPAQYVFATDTSCSAVLPDFRIIFPVRDNCAIASYTQTPDPGFILDEITMSVNVTLRAIDKSSNFLEAKFPATLVDTIKPRFVDSMIVDYQNLQIHKLYDAGDNIVKAMEQNLNNTFPFDSMPGAGPVNEYDAKMLVVVSQDSVNVRKRFISFADSVALY